MTTSTQLENEAQLAQADLANTIQELRSRVTVSKVADELRYEMSEGLGRDLARGLVRHIANNPVPAALITASVAWMFYSNGRVEPDADEVLDGSSSEYLHNSNFNFNKADQMADNMNPYDGAADKTASTIGNTAANAYETVSQGASNAAAATYDTVAHGASKAAAGASQAASAVTSAVKESGNAALRVVNYCTEHPLLLAGVGLAIGAAIGTAMPVSDAENKLLGPASDKLKRSAEKLAGEQLQKAEQAGEDALDQASQGLTQNFISEPNSAQPTSKVH